MQSNDGLVLCVGPEGNAGAESRGVSEMLAFNLVSKPQAGAGFLYSYFGRGWAQNRASWPVF